MFVGLWVREHGPGLRAYGTSGFMFLVSVGCLLVTAPA